MEQTGEVEKIDLLPVAESFLDSIGLQVPKPEAGKTEVDPVKAAKTELLRRAMLPMSLLLIFRGHQFGPDVHSSEAVIHELLKLSDAIEMAPELRGALEDRYGTHESPKAVDWDTEARAMIGSETPHPLNVLNDHIQTRLSREAKMALIRSSM